MKHVMGPSLVQMIKPKLITTSMHHPSFLKNLTLLLEACFANKGVTDTGQETNYSTSGQSVS